MFRALFPRTAAVDEALVPVDAPNQPIADRRALEQSVGVHGAHSIVAGMLQMFTTRILDFRENMLLGGVYICVGEYRGSSSC
ncbi:MULTISPECIES: hypothetical protein [unclassified Sphingomonas]|uniref:hypothetical protein n=1 Tax=unclassified Sphingomonas TaxID=196159 RepID=UPI0012E3C307|nr:MULTISPECIES: hypothetical protein [unclassified Sphingomonas]